MLLAKYESYLQRACRAILWIVWVAIIFMILLVVVDVFGRYVFNSPLPATVEMSELIMPIAIYPALAYALATRQHVRVSMVTDRLPPRVRSVFEILIYIIGLAFCVLLTHWGWQYFWTSFVVREEMLAAIPVPWWVGKFFVPFGGFFFTLYFLLLLLRALSHLSSRRKV
ncbi:Ectoine/5-hydroxyectoine TRAP transporter small permease protein UehB [subsurface metagenome]